MFKVKSLMFSAGSTPMTPHIGKVGNVYTVYDVVLDDEFSRAYPKAKFLICDDDKKWYYCPSIWFAEI